jgi:cytochrome c2
MRIGGARLRVVIFAAVCVLCGCRSSQQAPPYTVATGGSAARGEQVIARNKCGSCHTIPGINGANGVFGPPLNFMARRTTLAGNFPNEPNNLVRWVMNPEEMKPRTAMPDLGLSKQQARDVAAYLYTLE